MDRLTDTLERVRAEYIQESDRLDARRASLSPAAPLRRARVRGRELLLDRLGERLAVEKLCARLYDALINKSWASPGRRGPDIRELARMRDEELAHATVLGAWIRRLGADPAEETPSACSALTALRGVLQVVGDPRASVAHSMGAALAAELMDNSGWELLIDLAARLDELEMVEAFHRPAAREQEHLVRLKSWLGAELANGAL